MYAFSNWILGKEYIQPFGLLCIRLSITALILGVILQRRGLLRLPHRDWLAAVGLGFVGFVLSLGSQFVGTKWAGAANGSLITSTSPTFVVLFATLLLREQITWARVVSVVLPAIGVALVIGPQDLLAGAGDPQLFWGKVLLLVAGITWGLYTVIGKKFSSRYGALSTTFWASATATLLNLPLAMMEAVPRPMTEWPLTAWIALLYITVISTTIAFYLWNRGFELVDASKGAVFFFVQPVVGGILGWSLLGESLGVNFLYGALFIAAGVLVTLRFP